MEDGRGAAVILFARAKNRSIARILVSPEHYAEFAPRRIFLAGAGYPAVIDWDDTRKRSVRRLMHRLVLGLGPGEQGDHVNRDPLDCRRGNLRRATASENLANRRRPALSRALSSRYRGVLRHQGRWRATIGYQGRSVYIGMFGDEGSAARAYNEAARRLHGAFAALNEVPDEGVSAPHRGAS